LNNSYRNTNKIIPIRLKRRRIGSILSQMDMDNEDQPEQALSDDLQVRYKG